MPGPELLCNWVKLSEFSPEWFRCLFQEVVLSVIRVSLYSGWVSIAKALAFIHTLPLSLSASHCGIPFIPFLLSCPGVYCMWLLGTKWGIIRGFYKGVFWEPLSRWSLNSMMQMRSLDWETSIVCSDPVDSEDSVWSFCPDPWIGWNCRRNYCK